MRDSVLRALTVRRCLTLCGAALSLMWNQWRTTDAEALR